MRSQCLYFSFHLFLRRCPFFRPLMCAPLPSHAAKKKNFRKNKRKKKRNFSRSLTCVCVRNRRDKVFPQPKKKHRFIEKSLSRGPVFREYSFKYLRSPSRSSLVPINLDPPTLISYSHDLDNFSITTNPKPSTKTMLLSA